MLDRTSKGYLLKYSYIEPADQDQAQTTFGYLQGGRLHNLLGQPVPVFSHPESEEVFLPIQR